MIGITEWVNAKNGFTVIDLEYIADPDKRSEEWKRVNQAGVPKAEWNREYGSSWNVYDGKPVYGDYDEDVHLVCGTIVVPRKCKLISGWDGGPNDINLAWCLGVVFPDVPAVTWIDEYQVDDGDSTSFVEIVSSRLRMEWLKLGGFSIHACDQSIFTKSGVADGRSLADTMKRFGLFPIPAEISYAKRRQSVEDLLTKAMKWEAGKMVPRWRIHERCVLLRNAMKGGYCYPKGLGGINLAFKPRPIKNVFSHIANAMEYACSRISILENDIPYDGRRLPHFNRI